MIPGVSADQEALLINLVRPIALAQPLAFDKGTLSHFVFSYIMHLKGQILFVCLTIIKGISSVFHVHDFQFVVLYQNQGTFYMYQ